MPNTFNENTFSTTYKDDFSASNHYHRVLFNSGRALQARELTQMQTIIQEELARFGRNIFKEGSVVEPGGLDIDTSFEYVKLSAINDLAVGDVVQNSAGIQARIIKIVGAETNPISGASDPDTIYVDYISAGQAQGTPASQNSSNTTPIRFSASDALTEVGGSASGTATVQSTNQPANRPVGVGTRASVNRGAYFTRGHFVQADPQADILVSKYSGTPTTNIGFKVTEDIVTVDDTNTLYDNQEVLPNETAPGADRYRITLTLTTSDLLDAGDNFITINRLEDGILQQEIDRNTYAIIGDEMAIRTKETNGDFLAKDFTVKYNSATAANKLELDVSPGIAYVNGYRTARPATTKIEVDRARTTAEEENEAIPANFGNYVLVENSGTRIQGLPNIETLQKWDLLDDSCGDDGDNFVNANRIGTARIRAVEEDGSNYRYHIFDVQMFGSNNFRDARSIGLDSDNYGNLVLEGGIAVIKEAANNNLFFNLPRIRPQQLTDITLTTQRKFTQTATAGVATIDTSTVGGGNFADTTLWHVALDSGEHKSPTSITNNNTTAEINGLTPADGTFEILAYVQKTGTARLKTAITDSDHTGLLESDGAGFVFMQLPDADIKTFKEILDEDSNDISGRFRTDNGQRDNFYDNGRVIFKTGQTLPGNETVRVKYNFFEHGTSGDFFSVNSYRDLINAGFLTYEDIPTHKMRNGTTVELRNVLDFRSRKDRYDSDFVGGNAFVHALPRNGDLVTADVNYYLPRKDILIVTDNDELTYVQGEPNVIPQSPSTPDNAMKLYDFTLNAWTDNRGDLTVSKIDNRRYTMRDIGDIVKRIDDLEDTVSLSLLELETSTIEVLDSNNNNRFKNGFFAENFKDLTFTDFLNPEYRASLDVENNIMMPSFEVNNVNLFYDSARTFATLPNANTVIRNDFVMLSYDSAVLINQVDATETENVNPFDVIVYAGDMLLSPSVDEWREVTTIGQEVNSPPSEEELRARAESVIRPRLQSRVGELEEISVGDFINTEDTVLSSNTRRNRSGRTITTTTTVRTLVGQRVVTIDLLPFIRSRKVFFRASQLAPNRQHYLFFDGKHIQDYYRQEEFSNFNVPKSINDPLTDAQYSGATSHPETSSNLVTNALGEVSGSFFIPNNDTLQFDAGEREVKLLDISVNDDALSLSSASSTYTARGEMVSLLDVVDITNAIRRSTVPRPPRRRDPIAQSFQIQNSNGGFVTGIDVYFESKSTTVPIRLEVRPVENGVPSQETIIEGSIVVLDPADVVATDLNSNTTMTDVRNAPTAFNFDAPLYLEGNTEYAFVLIANTQEYNVYVAEIEGFLIGSNSQRVLKQPTLGSFFMSQNSITWTPDQRRDMMFRLRRAVFDTSLTGTAYIENDITPTVRLTNNPISTDSGSDLVTISLENHGFVVNDKVFIDKVDSGASVDWDSDTVIGGIKGSSIIGERTVQKVDGFGFQIQADSTATGTVIGGGINVQSERNIPMNTAIPNINTFVLPNSTLSFTGEFTNGASLVTSNAATNAQYGKPSSRIMSPSEPIDFTTPRVIASRRVEQDENTLLGSGSTDPRGSIRIKANLSTTDDFITPVIDMQQASITALSNLIDNQVDSDEAGLDLDVTVNVPINYVDETAAVGGSALSKHLTRPVNITEPAVGLKVLLAANRPANSTIELYYRTLSAGSDDDIQTKNFTLAPVETLPQTDENVNVFRQYEYTIGGLGGTLDPFTTFQLKVVMKSQNSSKVPRIRDLRAIALGT